MLGCKVDGFEQGIHKAHGVLEEFSHKVHKFDPMMALAGGLGGAGGQAAIEVAGAVMHKLHEAFEMPFHKIHEMFASSKLAERLGLTGAEMKGLKMAAAESGAEFDDLVRPIEKISAMIGQAALHGGHAEETFTQLGLSSESLARKTKPEQLVAVAHALERIASPAIRDAMSKEMFGRGFGAVKLSLQEIGEDFEGLKKKGEWLMGVKTPEQTKNIKEAAIATHESELAWESLKGALATELAPVISETAKELTGLLVSIRNLTTWIENKTGSVASLALEDGKKLKLPSWLASWAPEGAKLPAWLGGVPIAAGSVKLPGHGKKEESALDMLGQLNTSKGAEGADAGSTAAFEIIAENIRQGPVVAELVRANDKLDQLVEVQNETHGHIKKAATGEGHDL